MNKRISVAIDGPSGAGKSTLAKALAEKLGFLYVDTGAIYRTVGLHALRKGADTDDGASVAALLPELSVELTWVDGAQRMLLNGEDVTGLIRTQEVSMAASAVSKHPPVRQFLLETQRKLAREHSVIMDGRDIGTVVLPDAEVKIFLTATDEERAMRRYKELCEKGSDVSFDEVLETMRQRDRQDSGRAVAPLKPAEDAVMMDNTSMTLEESVEAIMGICNEKISGLA